jgi:hypothetical protein
MGAMTLPTRPRRPWWHPARWPSLVWLVLLIAAGSGLLWLVNTTVPGR